MVLLFVTGVRGGPHAKSLGMQAFLKGCPEHLAVVFPGRTTAGPTVQRPEKGNRWPCPARRSGSVLHVPPGGLFAIATLLDEKERS